MGRLWVRVRSRGTGHEYDVRADAVNENVHEVLEDYPTSLIPRAAKPRINIAPVPDAAHDPLATPADQPDPSGEAGDPSPEEI